ncbi:sulfatase [Candidatus Latescibacterota bacterium]
MGNRREFMKTTGLALSSVAASAAIGSQQGCSAKKKRPNILFCIADDWGWPHVGKYGDPTVKTPTFDRIADEGVLFNYAYVSSPSCSPSRNAILTGQYHWRLGEGANLWSSLDVNIPVYPLLLEEAGYHVGRWRKSWGPGDLAAGGYVDTHPAGKNYQGGFKEFLDARPDGTPFCFWLGASDPHRVYDTGSGKASGIDLDSIRLPEFYPDTGEIRSDIADYFFEVQRFDSDCGDALALLEETGELDNTLIVMTGDNGMPFPRCKSNLFDMGVHEPMAVRWGSEVSGGRVVNDFVSFIDFAPTFLDAAGVSIPEQMTGKTLVPLLTSGRDGRIEPGRDHVIFGKERHVPAQLAPYMGGYPCRGIRNDRYLYVFNFRPDLWPAGVPEGATHPMRVHADCDNGPTKTFLIEHRDDPVYGKFYDLSFAKRPQEELYDLSVDPDQLVNIARDPNYAEVRVELSGMLMAELKATSDPRVVGGGEKFDEYPYRSGYELMKTP